MDENVAGGSIRHRVCARIGLLGNPSDAYFGRTLALSISNFWASVALKPSSIIVFEPHPYHDLCSFTSLEQMVVRVQAEGYYGGVRLLMAACKTFYAYCSSHGIQLHDKNFTLSYDTNIPRQDFEKDHMQRTGNGIYTPLDPSLLPPLYIIYAENPSDSGKVHSTVRRRWLEGDQFIHSRMCEVADLAVKGRAALSEHDYDILAKLMNMNFDLRRQIFGDDALGETNIKMVETARSVGAACKFTGSGGAAVAFCPDGAAQVKQLMEACEKAGFKVELAVVAPPIVKSLQTNSCP
ncbi:hypothetical protein O6H91_02G100200 [Diphasiastrum complanatum]|uniref:Uncharacterized protein n=1 Tax=Diphasiastrum complanatum TaxID=34168 RepID=A0ACC2EIQ9_DIPCM|nr:hypothetical protein O6H91_02G100200 [Diphasiastrum complanatum]